MNLLMSRSLLAAIFIISLLVIVAGMGIFIRTLLKTKNRSAMKLTAVLAGLCVILIGFEIYMYLTTEGYLRILICIPMIIYGVTLVWLASWYRRPTVIISSKYSVDSERAKRDYIIQEFFLERRGESYEDYLDISVKPDRYNVKVIPVVVTRLDPKTGEEVSVRKNVNKCCVLMIEDILEKYNTKKWKSLPPDGDKGIDSVVNTIKAEYQNHEVVLFSDNMKIPEGGDKIFSEIEECILQYAGLKSESYK